MVDGQKISCWRAEDMDMNLLAVLSRIHVIRYLWNLLRDWVKISSIPI